MIFLTYNDSFSGIYKSQVIDVCTFLETEFGIKIKLVAFVSARTYSKEKKLIKSNYANSLVVPMFPKVRFWKVNTFTLFLICLFLKEHTIWARGAFACNMAIHLKKLGVHKILFDARGAYEAELNEYDVVQNNYIKNIIHIMEQKALAESNAQLAVSQQLVNWWKSKYNFTSQKKVVIPCTLSKIFCTEILESTVLDARQQLGFTENDVVLVYSGSSAGWQSFGLVDEILFDLFSSNEHVKLIFLSNEIPHQSKTFTSFKGRIITKWVKPHEVPNILLAADYGLLIREDSITNKVSSPVKFAEYLACGLQVIISNNIGDFSDFVTQHNCGYIFNKDIILPKVPFSKKATTNSLALLYFQKEAVTNKQAYKMLLDFIG